MSTVPGVLSNDIDLICPNIVGCNSAQSIFHGNEYCRMRWLIKWPLDSSYKRDVIYVNMILSNEVTHRIKHIQQNYTNTQTYMSIYIYIWSTYRSSCDDVHWQQGTICIYSWQFWQCLIIYRSLFGFDKYNEIAHTCIHRHTHIHIYIYIHIYYSPYSTMIHIHTIWSIAPVLT